MSFVSLKFTKYTWCLRHTFFYHFIHIKEQDSSHCLFSSHCCWEGTLLYIPKRQKDCIAASGICSVMHEAQADWCPGSWNLSALVNWNIKEIMANWLSWTEHKGEPLKSLDATTLERENSYRFQITLDTGVFIVVVHLTVSDCYWMRS